MPMKVDRLFQNGMVFCTYRKCFEHLDLAVVGSLIFRVAHNLEISAKEVIDCSGKYLIPGLIDIHMHIDSSMTHPAEFSRKVLPYGVTTIVADPHEIANVFGLEGIRSFMQQKTALDIFYGIPSCVPATNPLLETSGGMVDEETVRALLKDPKILCLGEVMNYKDLAVEEDTMLKGIITQCRKDPKKLRLEGHIPYAGGEECSQFAFWGVDADHTQQTPESVVEKTDLGIFLELQGKSLTKEVVEAVKKNQLYENMALVTDDTMPDNLVFDGQMDRIIRKAIQAGMPVEEAIYCSTLTPARRMHLDDRGILAPGKLADFSILPDLTSFRPEAVYKNGVLVQEEIQQDPKALFPPHFFQSVHPVMVKKEDFHMKADIQDGIAQVLVMEIQPMGTKTIARKRKIPVKKGLLCWQEAGLNLVAVYERYGKNRQFALGFLEGGLTKKGAVATTWSHDSHNLLVVGNNPADMQKACSQIVSIQGGYTVVSHGQILATAYLSIGGIVSAKPLEILAEEIRNVRGAIEGLGYHNNNVLMSISTLSLLASPELKLSDQGLFFTKSQEKQSLILNYEKGDLV